MSQPARSFMEFWETIERGNPAMLESETLTLRPREFQRAMRLAWDAGAKSVPEKADGPLSVFETIFGRNK